MAGNKGVFMKNNVDKFHCDNMTIRDQYNRQRIFRGINICIKKNNRKALKGLLPILDDKFFKLLNKCGINIIRLGLTWEIIEPEEGCFDREVIDIFKKFAYKCRENSIYIFLDMHQDLFSVHCCKPAGDGAPKWALDKSIKPKRPFAIWAEGYFYMDGVQKAFYDFWNNKSELQKKYAKAWQFFAKEFEDLDNIIGYDYLNEPYLDKNGRTVFLTLIEQVIKLSLNKTLSLGKNFENCSDKIGFLKSVLKIAAAVKTPKNLIKVKNTMDNKKNFAKVLEGFDRFTAEFNKEYYEPFFKSISAEINTGEKFNLFEHNYYSNLGIPFEIDCDKKSVYSPHAYDVFVDSPLYNKYSSNERITHIIETIRENQLKMNVPVLFGEWGGNSIGTQWLSHIDYIMDLFEKFQWSNVYWGFNAGKAEFVKTFNRPYPVAVNGDIIKIKTDSKAGTFYLSWEQYNTDAKNIIFVPNEGMRELDGKIGKNEITISYQSEGSV